MIIKKEIVDSLFAQFGESDITQLSIREVGKLVAQIEQQSGQEFIHMEMGVPGLPASAIAIDAEKRALDTGLAAQYPNIEGIPFAKTEIARFAKLFINIDVSPLNCVPTVGGMQGSFAALLAALAASAPPSATLPAAAAALPALTMSVHSVISPSRRMHLPTSVHSIPSKPFFSSFLRIFCTF